MSDTVYGLECLVRERARAIEREGQRRRRLALVRTVVERRYIHNLIGMPIQPASPEGRMPWPDKMNP